MNILFVNYGDQNSNSINHIGPYANELTRLGNSCSVAIESRTTEIPTESRTPLYQYFTYAEILKGREAFPNAKPADIVHAWTPRENVRKFTEEYRSRFPISTLIVHLEDNEDAILESHYQRPIDQLRFPDPDETQPEWEQRLSHPVEYKKFLARADAVTVLTPTLEKLLPVPKPVKLIFPIVYKEDFNAEIDPIELKESYAIPQTHKLIVFPGGITSNNREDVRKLYIAVKLLNDRGTKCIIAKTGPNCDEFESSFEFPLESVSINLGFVPKIDVAKLISISDVLVQPGTDNSFNRDRFPCKIPEYLISGKPTIVPSFYFHTYSADASYCMPLFSSSPEEIAQQCLKIFENQSLAENIGKNGKAFAAKTYSAENNLKSLLDYYNEALDLSRNNPTTKTYHIINLPEKLAITERDNSELKTKLQLQLDDITTLLKNAHSNKVELQQIRSEVEQRENKINRMTGSFSWKITSVLRLLRRTFVDPHSKTATEQSNQKQQSLEENPPTSGKDTSEKERPPENHPCYHKNYYDYVRIYKIRVNEYVDLYNSIGRDYSNSPKISILLPVYNVDEKWLRLCIESVLNQIYPKWELCIADDASTKPHVRKVLDEYAERDERINVLYRESNGHISRCSNSAFTLATGEYIALLDHDDELPPHALARLTETILEYPNAKLIYSDEDKIDNKGIQHGPHFKSDWNYDLFLGCNMISHLGVYKRDAFEASGGFRTGYEGAQDWDLALRIIEHCQESEIVHIPEILYHWRSIEGSTATNIDQKQYAHKAQKKALLDHLSRKNIDARLESIEGNHWRIIYSLPKVEPKVSIIILTRDRLDLLIPCVNGILTKTDYVNYDIILVDNASKNIETHEYLKRISLNPRIKVIHDNSPFNYSAINNHAILKSNSSIICLLNNDTEVITSEWLSELVRHTCRSQIGIVGAKLLFPHQHVQHGGIIMGVGGIAAHAFKFLHKDDDGHLSRAKLVSRYAATTGACMAFNKTLWEKLGGLDEVNLPISYNDVDFCLRAALTGLATVVTPFALLYHKESETRGGPRTDKDEQQFCKEQDYMFKKWRNFINSDPYYNINLARGKEDFSYCYDNILISNGRSKSS